MLGSTSAALSCMCMKAFPGSCTQVFLITDKDATPGVFAALSVNLRKYRYVFADIHAGDTAAMQRLSITKVIKSPCWRTLLSCSAGFSAP